MLQKGVEFAKTTGTAIIEFAKKAGVAIIELVKKAALFLWSLIVSIWGYSLLAVKWLFGWVFAVIRWCFGLVISLLRKCYTLAVFVAAFSLEWHYVIWDSEISRKIRLIALVAAVYVVNPIDFIPDIFPIVGQLDDIGIVYLAWKYWVQEYMTEAHKKRAIELLQPILDFIHTNFPWLETPNPADENNAPNAPLPPMAAATPPSLSLLARLLPTGKAVSNKQLSAPSRAQAYADRAERAERFQQSHDSNNSSNSSNATNSVGGPSQELLGTGPALTLLASMPPPPPKH